MATDGAADPPQVQQQQQQQQPRLRDHGSQAAVAFLGDVSAWGARRASDGADDGASSTAADTFSSGVSPRDSRPRTQPFDLGAAQQALAYQASMFSRAQALRRDGCAPAGMGVPDDLPTRMAVTQLDALAGMASKVQDAILHNKRIFEQRLLAEDRALQRRALHGWLLRVSHAAAKQRVLARASARLQRGRLLRAFFSWRGDLHHADRTLAMKRKVRLASMQQGRRGVLACSADAPESARPAADARTQAAPMARSPAHRSPR
jgi:hypothetical protein